MGNIKKTVNLSEKYTKLDPDKVFLFWGATCNCDIDQEMDQTLEQFMENGTPTCPLCKTAFWFGSCVVEKEEGKLEEIKETVRMYHYGLDSRGHGGVLANILVDKVEEILGMPWERGKELEAKNRPRKTK